jgi:hypothetical protein
MSAFLGNNKNPGIDSYIQQNMNKCRTVLEKILPELTHVQSRHSKHLRIENKEHFDYNSYFNTEPYRFYNNI